MEFVVEQECMKDELQNLSEKEINKQEDCIMYQGNSKVKVEEFQHDHIEQPEVTECEMEENIKNQENTNVNLEEFTYDENEVSETAFVDNDEEDPELQEGNQETLIIKEEIEIHDDQLWKVAANRQEIGAYKMFTEATAVELDDELIVCSENVNEAKDYSSQDSVIKVEKYKYYHNENSVEASAQKFDALEELRDTQTRILGSVEYVHFDDILPHTSLENNEETEQRSEKMSETAFADNDEENQEKLRETQTGIMEVELEHCDEITQDVSDMCNKCVPSTSDIYLVEDKEESDIDMNLQCHVVLEKIYYKCDICGYVTVIKQMLESHMKVHNVKQFYSDDECGSKSKFLLEKCKQKKNSDKCKVWQEENKGPLKEYSVTHTYEKPYTCPLCLHKSARTSHLKQHLLMHVGGVPHVCEFCPFKTIYKSVLKRHVSKHTGEQPYACNLCPYKSSDKSHLNQHILSHTDEKPYSCNLCSYKSSYKYSLKRHMLTHSAEKRYSCNYCSYKSVRKSNLKQHTLKHSGEKPYACDFCSFRSAYKPLLKRHVLKKHTGDKA